MKNLSNCLVGLFILTPCLMAGPNPKSPSTNAKDDGVLLEFNKSLKEEGWHRKEANRMTDELAHTFGDAVLRPTPNFTHHVSRLLETYQADYSRFQDEFPEACASNPPLSEPSTLPGMWSHIRMNPTAGRIYDLELNPENPKEIYANPDGDGIYFTHNGGRNWRAITDSIPERLHRDSAENIIVDPKDFSHVFSISRLGHMYETKDRGVSWTFKKNTAHKVGSAPQFKWVEAFRDADDALILIGTVTKDRGLNPGWRPGIYRSDNFGTSWKHIQVLGDKWQEMAFHKKEKNVVYLGGRAKLFVSRNAGKNFELLNDFKVGDRPMFVTTLHGDDSDSLYVVVSKGNNTEVHFSADQGVVWEERQNTAEKVGYEKGIFGTSGSSGWTSFFEVDPFDKNHLMASSVGSCESFDGGVNWTFFSWGKRANAVMPDGSLAPSPHGGHNADNHVLKFHPALRGFRVKGCDAGIMMKKEIKATNWTNVNGDMPAFLWYSIVVNEFGDRYIAGNTQDVNVQSYRYGRWENEIGYEGDSIFINPYTNMTYFPCSPTEKGEGLNFLEPGRWKMHSWNMPKSAPNYSKPDQCFVAFGRRPTSKSKQLPKYLYVTDNRGVSYKRVENLDKEAFVMNMSRTKEQTLTVLTAKSVMSTTDMGKTWQGNPYPKDFKVGGRSRKVGGAINPANPQQLWVSGLEGKVLSSSDGGKSWKDISGELPKGQISELAFHEGTAGDLYALVHGYGVFYKAATATDWTLWMKGFNLKDFREIRIDYPSQKLVAASYARGAWEAPLMNPCERFHKNGFAIKQLNDSDGVNVFGIDSNLVTPDYYNYRWTIDGMQVGANTPTLITGDCKPGSRVNLTLSPRFCPAVKTVSGSIEARNMPKASVKAAAPLTVEMNYIDLGVVELFGAKQEFTFETAVKLTVSGVIAGNRRNFYRDAKGWFLSVNDTGQLSLHLSPKQNGNLSRTFGQPKDQAFVIASPEGAIAFNTSVQLAFSVSATGTVVLYVNGDVVGTGTLDKHLLGRSLNSVLSMALLSDPIGMKPTAGEVAHVRIWHKLLDGAELNAARTTFTTTTELVYCVIFNGKDSVERFTGRRVRTPRSQMREWRPKMTANSSQRGNGPKEMTDGSPSTIWHTAWEGVVPQYPHEFTMTLQKPTQVSGIKLLPRQDNPNGLVKDIEIYVSSDGRTWGEPIAKASLGSDTKWKTIDFPKEVSVKAIKVKALSPQNPTHPWASFAEVQLVDDK